MYTTYKNNPIYKTDNARVGWYKLKTNKHNATDETLEKRKVKQCARPNENHGSLQMRIVVKYIDIRNKFNDRFPELKEHYWQRFSN